MKNASTLWRTFTAQRKPAPVKAKMMKTFSNYAAEFYNIDVIETLRAFWLRPM
jgi:hypothetical protein